MEFLEDIENRILLLAISREKKVCEQVDKESCREPHETSLTDICKSLEHKFMYDRLFKKIYEQGRADGIMQGRADAIKSIEKFVDEWDGAIIISASMGVVCGQEVIDELKELLVQMKEQSNDQR